MVESPYEINLGFRGNESLGFLTVAEFPENIPFAIKRVYWTYHTPENQERGFHAHKDLSQIIFCVSGTILFKTEDRYGVKRNFSLSDPSVGLFIPPLVWREIVFKDNSVLLCLASELYIEEDYIRDYKDFKLKISEYEQK